MDCKPRTSCYLSNDTEKREGAKERKRVVQKGRRVKKR